MDKRTKKRIREQILDGTIYQKKRYKNWRKKIFERDRYTCQLCSKSGGFIQAHHIKKKYKYPESIYHLLNGITLCYNCHRKIHKEGIEKKYTRRFRKLARENKPKPRMIRRK